MSGSGRRWLGISLGSNAGPRRDLLEGAAGYIAETLDLTETRLSGLFETEPWGTAEGPRFLNCVLVGRTGRGPTEVLEACRSAESRAGSPTRKGGGARRLDADVLFLEGAESAPPALRLPHPRMHRRRFVLVPLSQVWDGEVPGLGADPDRLLEEAADPGSVVELKPPPSAGATAWKDRE
jgi:2-amino-4-hydroxy-6-hydroxymethyldihydropteridine diphosphokinase